MRSSLATLLALPLLSLTPNLAFAWGDDGHKTVALIAQQCLTPSARKAVNAFLAADTDDLTPHDIANAATSVDKYRDENNRHDHYKETQNLHFTDIEIDHPDLTSACFGRQPLPAGALASNGPAQACAVDKIEQFSAGTRRSRDRRRRGAWLSSSCFTLSAICTSHCTHLTTTTLEATRFK